MHAKTEVVSEEGIHWKIQSWVLLQEKNTLVLCDSWRSDHNGRCRNISIRWHHSK
jgi:hypothetical protein